MTDATVLFQALITLCAAVITVIIIPWVKSKIHVEQLDLIRQWADVLVAAAEVLFKGEKTGMEKKDFVLKQLKAKCEEQGYTFSEQELEIILESAWEMICGELSNTAGG